MSALMQQMKQDSPRVLFDMNEGAGITIWDYSGNNFHGTQGGVANYRNADVVPGFKGLRLTPNSGYVSFASDLNWGQGVAVSFSWWMIWNATSAAPTISTLFSKYSAPKISAIYMGAATNGQLIAHDFNTVDEYGWMRDATNASDLLPTAGTPYHYAVTFSAANIGRWYRNGVQQNVRYQIGPTYATVDGLTWTTQQRTNLGTERIGLNGNSNPDVTLGPVGMYQAELSADRVKAHYQAGIRQGAVMG